MTARRPRRVVAATALLAIGLLAVSCGSGDDHAAPGANASGAPRSTSTAAPSTTAPPARLTERSCGVALAQPTRCYAFVVPERRDVASERMMTLWVAVVTPSGTPQGAVPRIRFSGTSRTANSATLVDGSYPFHGSPAPTVIVDERGSGLSVPVLTCGEIVKHRVESTHPWAERLAERRGAVAACRDRLAAGGVDLDAYDTVESAADLVALRKALGYEQWGIEASGYGGRLALEVYRQDRSGVAWMLLDGSWTSSPQGPASVLTRGDAALERFAHACDVQPACVAANGSVANHLFDVAARLDASAHPVVDAGGVVRGHITGDDYYDGVFGAMYDSTVIATMADSARRIDQGDLTVLDDLAISQSAPRPGRPDVHDRDVNGLSEVMECADDAGSFTDADRAAVAAPGRWSTLLINGVNASCDVWNVKPIAGGGLVWPDGDVPTLIMSGQLDPITPRPFADAIAEHLTSAHLVEVPGGGHVVAYDSECASRISTSFIDDPTGELDTSCLASMPAPFSR